MNNYGDKKRSPFVIAISWVAAIASLALVYFATRAMISDILSFRSCSINDSGLSVVNCGKQAISFGDVLLAVLLLLSILLSVSLFTGAWRASRRRKRA